jgi:FtsH-binding integral membrane protein
MPRKRNDEPELGRVFSCRPGGEMKTSAKPGTTTLQIPLVSAEQVVPRVSEQTTSTLAPAKRFLNRYFYFSMSLLLAALVTWGFSRTVNDNLFHAAPPRPFLLWIHGATFSGWMVFFIAQSILVRVHRVNWHRFLGWFGVVLATAMVPLGIAIAIIMARFDAVQLHQSGTDAFLAIPFYGIIAFGVIIAVAIFLRKKPEFHRRLTFIATCGLMDAPLDRFDFLFYHNLSFLCVDLLIALGVVRDLVVDRSVHKVYRWALPVLIVGQSLAMYLWRSDPSWWGTTTHAILG